jgi:hypothetical protein
MTEMYNAVLHETSDKDIEQFLSGTRVFTEDQKQDIRERIHAANKAGLRTYKVHFDGPNYVLVRNGVISGVDQDGSKFDKEEFGSQ